MVTVKMFIPFTQLVRPNPVTLQRTLIAHAKRKGVEVGDLLGFTLIKDSTRWIATIRFIKGINTNGG